jgi:methylmalonyl-CoA/ethylmalonyl-CoA epimerase
MSGSEQAPDRGGAPAREGAAERADAADREGAWPDRVGAIDHVAVAVETLDEAVAIFTRLLGSPPAFVRTSEAQQVRVAVWDLEGARLELMEGTAADSTVTKFVAKRGAGLHHVCYAVEDLKGTLERARREGFEVLGTGDDTGVEGRAVAFIHPRSTGGVLTEFIQAEGTGD